MIAAATTSAIKQINKKTIFDYIYREKQVSKQLIASSLSISLPTVSQNLKELEDLSLIERKGFYQSTGGRKAQAISCVTNARLSIGIAIFKKQIQIVAVDLYGSILKNFEQTLPFVNSVIYYQAVGALLDDFIQSLHVSPKKILGVGIALQGLISPDGKTVTYGKILGCTNLTIDRFSSYISYPCYMIHDAEAAATSELWCNASIIDAIYFHLGQNISGAVIINSKIYKGRELRSGIIEHMTIIPDGTPCYCGKKGCLETYCSIDSLLKENETLDTFFANLRSGNPSVLLRFDNYLKYLAIAVDNIHMLMDCDIILGGQLASYLKESDIRELQFLIEKGTAFPIEQSYIKMGKNTSSPIAQGAALPFIAQFLNSVTT